MGPIHQDLTKGNIPLKHAAVEALKKKKVKLNQVHYESQLAEGSKEKRIESIVGMPGQNLSSVI